MNKIQQESFFFQKNSSYKWDNSVFPDYIGLHSDAVIRAVLDGNIKSLEECLNEEGVWVNRHFSWVILAREKGGKRFQSINTLSVAALLGSKEMVELLLPKSNPLALSTYIETYLYERSFVNESCNEIITSHIFRSYPQVVHEQFRTLTQPDKQVEGIVDLWERCKATQEEIVEVVYSHIRVSVLTQVVVDYVVSNEKLWNE